MYIVDHMAVDVVGVCALKLYKFTLYFLIPEYNFEASPSDNITVSLNVACLWLVVYSIQSWL